MTARPLSRRRFGPVAPGPPDLCSTPHSQGGVSAAISRPKAKIRRGRMTRRLLSHKSRIRVRTSIQRRTCRTPTHARQPERGRVHASSLSASPPAANLHPGGRLAGDLTDACHSGPPFRFAGHEDRVSQSWRGLLSPAVLHSDRGAAMPTRCGWQGAAAASCVYSS